jgi:hypothetical protein
LGPTFFASGSADATQLEYTDLFVHPGPMEEIRWSEVLKPSVAVTPEQLGRPGLWHSHVGWFELDRLGRQVLVRINIDATPHVTPGSISLRLNTLLALGSPIGQPGSLDIDLLLIEIDRLHEWSKRIFGSLLCEDIARRISLFSPEEE